jgi:hypothetical protein
MCSGGIRGKAGAGVGAGFHSVRLLLDHGRGGGGLEEEKAEGGIGGGMGGGMREEMEGSADGRTVM